MKKLLLFTGIAMFLGGCSKITIKNNQYSVLGPDNFYFLVQNTQGQNLLDPSTPGYFKEEDIKIIYLTDGVEKLYYEPHLDWSRGFYLSPGYRLMISFNRAKSGLSSATTYIQWNNQDRDTLVCHFLKSENGRQYVEKVFMNDQLMIPEGVSTIEHGYNGATLKIVK